MEKTKSLISVTELKRLLVTIVDYNLPICIRYRLLGEMWQPQFMRVVKVTENGVLLNDEKRGRLILVPDLTHLTQFELDGRLHTFEPNYHYTLTKEFSP
jgi:hypothetical protein